jgi:hypothetical protein
MFSNKETTPLLSGTATSSEPQPPRSPIFWFHRRPKQSHALSYRDRSSVRGPSAFPFFPGKQDDRRHFKELVPPVEALSPLVAGGRIVSERGTVLAPARPPTIVKSIPACPPYVRTTRHRSFYLWWINEFRHWWKSSRLLVRLAGLDGLAREVWVDMTFVIPKGPKNGRHFRKFVKRLGGGGIMHVFLDRCQPVTRSIRLLVATWRWIESAKVRRLEVGVEESMVSIQRFFSRQLYTFSHN